METGRPARRGDPSPDPTYEAVPSTLVFRNASSFAGGGAIEDLGRFGFAFAKTCAATPATYAPEAMTEGVRGLPRGGAPAMLHSTTWSGHTGPSSRRPRPTSRITKSSRVVRLRASKTRNRTERGERVERSVSIRSTPGKPGVLSLGGTGEAGSKQEPVRSRNAQRVKGRWRVARHVP
jgi:hypothetical protein